MELPFELEIDHIGLFGSTGCGKSSLINSFLFSWNDDSTAQKSFFSTITFKLCSIINENLENIILCDDLKENVSSISRSLRSILREVESLADDLTVLKSSFARDHSSIRREWENPLDDLTEDSSSISRAPLSILRKVEHLAECESSIQMPLGSLWNGNENPPERELSIYRTPRMLRSIGRKIALPPPRKTSFARDLCFSSDSFDILSCESSIYRDLRSIRREIENQPGCESSISMCICSVRREIENPLDAIGRHVFSSIIRDIEGVSTGDLFGVDVIRMAENLSVGDFCDLGLPLSFSIAQLDAIEYKRLNDRQQAICDMLIQWKQSQLPGQNMRKSSFARDPCSRSDRFDILNCVTCIPMPLGSFWKGDENSSVLEVSICSPIRVIRREVENLPVREASIFRPIRVIRREVENLPVHEASIFRPIRVIRREVENLPVHELSIFRPIRVIRREVENLPVREASIFRSIRIIRIVVENLLDNLTSQKSFFSRDLFFIRREKSQVIKPFFSLPRLSDLFSIGREVENPPDLTARKLSFTMTLRSIFFEWTIGLDKTPQSPWTSVMYGEPADGEPATSKAGPLSTSAKHLMPLLRSPISHVEAASHPHHG